MLRNANFRPAQRRPYRAFVLGLLVAFVMAACAPAVAPEPGAPDAAGPSLATITFVQEPDSLNPIYTAMWFSGILHDLWLLGLWNFDDNLEPVPQLAREIPTAANGGISEDGTVIIVHLREDAPGRRPASYQRQQLLLALFQPPPAEPDGNLSAHPALQSETRHTIVSLRPS